MKEKKVENLDIIKVCVSGKNYRKSVKDEGLKELAESIRNFGIINPISVKVKDYQDDVDESTGEILSIPIGYQVICGERRYKAMRLLYEEDVHNKKFQKIPAIVYENISEKQEKEMQMTENLMREDVDAFEEGEAFKEMMKGKITIESLSQRFGKSDKYIRGRIQLTNLITEVKEMVKNGDLSLGAGIYISRFTKEEQMNLRKNRYIEKGFSESHMKDIIERNLHKSMKNVLFGEDEVIEGFEICSRCPMNSACQGRLFGEREIEEHYCANGDCMEKKNIKKLLMNIAQIGDDVKLVYESADNKILKILGDAGVKVYDFWSRWARDWQNEEPDEPVEPVKDDYENGKDNEEYKKDMEEYPKEIEKYKKNLEEWKRKREDELKSGKVERLIKVCNYYGFVWEEMYGRVKEEREEDINEGGSDGDVNEKLKNAKIKTLEDDLTAKRNKRDENIVIDLRKLMSDEIEKDYRENERAMSMVELTMMYIIMIDNAGFETKRIFTDKIMAMKRDEDVRFIDKEMFRIMRCFISEKVTESGVMYDDDLQFALKKIVEEIDKDKYDEIVGKHERIFEKRRDKIQKQIKEIEEE